MPNESIGGISVSISVGLQDLQAQFEQAQQMADAAGKAMASAFNNASGGAAGGINEVSKALEGFNVSALATGFALNQVGNAISGFSDGVFQLGARALETAGKFEQWTVSFTTLLHSEEAAKSMLADLVDFAIRTPFEIPDVVNNAQKLMAFGFAAQEVIPMLTTLGDAVAGLGKGASSLNSLTLAFGEMESKGVIQLRQLNMLTLQGIPAIEALAKAYDVSISEMSSMITKKLIPASEGIPILLAAINDRFGGLMEKQSQTFLGMLSNLSDAATKTFRAIGDTMLSSAKQFEEFGFSFLTEVQQLAEAFGRLPTPVQDAAIALGVLAAAAGPVVLILGNLAIAVGAIGAAMPVLAPIAGVIAGIGAELALIHFSGLDSEVKQFASDLVDSFDRVKFSLQEVAGIARDEAGSAFESLSSSLSDLATMARPILGVLEAIIPDLKELETTAGAAFEQIRSGKANVDLLKGAFDSFFPILSGIVLAIHNARIEMQIWVELFEVATGRFKSMSDAAKDIQTQLDKNSKVTSEFKDEMNRLSEAMKPVSKGTLDVVDSQAKLETAYEQAQKTYAEMKKLFNEHLVGASEVARAYDAMKVAFAAAHPELKSVGGEIDTTTGKFTGMTSTVGGTRAATDLFKASLQGLAQEYSQNQRVIDTYTGSINKLVAIQNRSVEQEGMLDTAIAKRWELIQKNIKAIGEQMGAEDKALASAQQMVKSASELTTKEQAATLAVGLAKAVLDQLTASTDTSAEHTRAVTDALNQYATALKNTGVPLNGLITLTKDGVQYTTTLAEALGHAKEGMMAFSDEAVTVPQSVDKAWQATDQFGRALRETVDGATGVMDVLRILPPVAAEAKRQFDQIGYGAGNSAALIKGLTDEMSRNIAAAGKAVNANSALVNSINHVGEATSDALAVEKAWSSGTSTAVDNTSKFANSISHAASELHNMSTKTDREATAAFDMDQSFKATTGSVNALSVGVAFLAMQLSGLTAFAGSGINYAAGQSDLQHQLYLARQAAGDPTAQPANFTVATSGALKGQSFNSLDDLNQALADLAKNTDAAATSTEKLSNATAKSTQSTLQYVDGVGNIYDSYQEMIDAIAANPNLGGLTSTIDRLSSTATTANTATQQAAQAQQQFVDGLGNVYDSYQALTAAIAANPLLGGPATSSTGDKISGPSSMPSTMAEALANMTKLATPNGATGDSKIPNVLGTFNGQVITGSPGMSLSDAIALMHIGVGSGSGAITALPGSMVTSNGTSNYTGVPSNQQGGTNGQGIVVNMNYPSFNSQQQADQVMKQVVTQLRTVTGLKL